LNAAVSNQMSMMSRLQTSSRQLTAQLESERDAAYALKAEKQRLYEDLEEAWSGLDDDARPPGVSFAELAGAWSEAVGESFMGAGQDVKPAAKALPVDPRPYEFQTSSSGLSAAAGRVGDAAADDLYDRGVRLYVEGELKGSVSSLEACVRLDPGHPRAWLHLGYAHQELDNDSLAISCLERAAKEDAYDGEVMRALAVSYVNEMEGGMAEAAVKGWMATVPELAGVGGGDVLEVVRRCAAVHPSGEANEVLGVLLSSRKDWDGAVAALTASADLRPSHSIYNKLGATLANAGRPREALSAYKEAIKLKPRYGRAWLNLAVAHTNMKSYEEACRCYLQAIAMGGADRVWGYLRLSLTCMERWDLLEAAGKRDLDAFSQEFDFVKFDAP